MFAAESGAENKHVVLVFSGGIGIMAAYFHVCILPFKLNWLTSLVKVRVGTPWEILTPVMSSPHGYMPCAILGAFTFIYVLPNWVQHIFRWKHYSKMINIQWASTEFLSFSSFFPSHLLGESSVSGTGNTMMDKKYSETVDGRAKWKMR